MKAKTFSPGANVSFDNDWSALTPEGGNIASRKWTINPNSVPALDPADPPDTITLSPDDQPIVDVLFPMTRGVDYVLLEHVTFSDGTEETDGFFIRIEGGQ